LHPPEEKEKEEENISPSENANVYYNKKIAWNNKMWCYKIARV